MVTTWMTLAYSDFTLVFNTNSNSPKPLRLSQTMLSQSPEAATTSHFECV
jgi:hypothetical protein